MPSLGPGSVLARLGQKMNPAASEGTQAARNLDPDTVAGFGVEWNRYDQKAVSPVELRAYFDAYFKIFPWNSLPPAPVGFDMGCGSGRWANLVAPRVAELHCIDASKDALAVAKRNLADHTNCVFHNESVDTMSLEPRSMDFGYSLGVLHHIPDPLAGLRACTRALKPGAPFLVYLYYAFDNRPAWFRTIWRASDALRRAICQLPPEARIRLTQVIAASIYWPLARTARALERFGLTLQSLPLYAYREASFYTMQTDALDRFGTKLEHRFSAEQVRKLMESAGIERVTLNQDAPFWCAVGYAR